MLQLFEEEKPKAIAYYRHSAEDKQENSVLIQSKDTEKLLAQHSVELIHTDADEGVSGVNAKRPAFERIINDWVLNPNAPKFTYVCVYDVSRWGRFQDDDEAGYWEFLCRKHGKTVIYVSHGWPQENEESNMINGLRKSIERYAAAEYSRKLSRDVVKGCIEVSEQGYSAGGMAPYGYIRVLLSEQRERLGVLKHGEHKAIANQRVTFEPATDGQAEVVKRTFREFVDKGKFPDEIAIGLNRSNVKTATGKEWRTESVVRILRNETYTGTRVYNRTWGRLKRKKRRNPEEEWTRCLNAHEALVTAEVFRMAGERLRYLRPRTSNEAVRRFRAAESYVWRYIRQTIKDFSDDQQSYIKQYFPAVFGTVYESDNEKQTCFYLPMTCRKYDRVLAFSLDTNGPESSALTGIHCFDRDLLPNVSYLLVDKEAESFRISPNELPEVIRSICDSLLAHDCPWLKPEPVLATPVIQ